MTLSNITISFQMTIPSVEVDKEDGIVIARKAVKRMARDMFINLDEPWDDIVIIDCPDYPALIE